MDELRKEFESIPEIEGVLQFVDGFNGNCYYSLNNQRTSDWLNGAWHMFKYLKGIKQ